ncbi:MAG: hypothetical protein KDK72_05415, partial [Chlamydiia bacterium]|nr:hypothetical protein [Chlamydiia bacterium]
RLNNEEGLKWKIERYLKFIQRVHNFIPAVYIEIFEEQGEKIFHDLRSGKIESEDPLQQEMQKLVLEAFTGFDEKVKPRRSLRPVEFSVSLTDLEHNDETLLSIRNCCDALLQAFRKCTQLAASRNDKWAAAADLLAWKIFTQIDFSEFFHRTMKRFDEIERSVDPWQPQIVLVNQRFNPSLFFHEFDRVKENLSSLPSEVTTHFLDRMAKSIYKGLGNVDPLFDDKNFPNIVFSCSRGNEKPPVRAIAFGTPTTYKAETPSSNNPVQYVAPEFIAAIRTFQRKGLTYLVCIRQDMIPSITNLFEWKRVEAQLEFEKTIKETVYSYVTSMDTEFYKQSGIWEDKCQSTNFKKALISEFFTNPSDETGNYYSEKTRDKYKKLKQDSLDLIEEIHKIVFNSKTVLSQQERCAYHDLFTSFQKIAICHNISADYLSDICRDTCDRSMLSLVLLLTLLSIVSGDIEKPWFAQNFYSTFFFRALSALKRLTQEKRVARCKQTLEIFFQHREEIRELFKKIFPGMTLAPQQYI